MFQKTSGDQQGVCPLFLFSGVKSAGRFCSLIWWNSKTKWRMKWQHFWIWTCPDPRQSSLNCLFLQSYIPQVYTANVYRGLRVFPAISMEKGYKNHRETLSKGKIVYFVGKPCNIYRLWGNPIVIIGKEDTLISLVSLR